MGAYNLFVGMKKIKIRIYFVDDDGDSLDISGYTTTTKINYKYNNDSVAEWSASIEDTYYLVYTIPEILYSGTLKFQGIIENSAGVLLKSKIFDISIQPALS